MDLPELTGIVAWGWTCDGLKGMALGHLKPTAENTHQFIERNVQVFPLVVKPEVTDISTLTDRELCLAFAHRFAARNPDTALSVTDQEVALLDDRFGISFLFDAEGRLHHKSDLRIGRHHHD